MTRSVVDVGEGEGGGQGGGGEDEGGRRTRSTSQKKVLRAIASGRPQFFDEASAEADGDPDFGRIVSWFGIGNNP